MSPLSLSEFHAMFVLIPILNYCSTSGEQYLSYTPEPCMTGINLWLICCLYRVVFVLFNSTMTGPTRRDHLSSLPNFS